MSITEWLKAENEAGRQAIPADDPIFEWANRVRLPAEHLALAWDVFKAKYQPDMTAPQRPKVYADWRAVFRRAVQEDWLKLWVLLGDDFQLTTKGAQAARAHGVKVRRPERARHDVFADA